MEFHVDALTSAYISGWGYDSAGPIPLQLVVNGRTLAQTLADGYRPDLEAAGLASGHLAFTFKLRRPGLAAGDELLFRHARTGDVLHSTRIDHDPSSAVNGAYGLEQTIEPFTSPYWRPVLTGAEDGSLVLSGELFVPDRHTARPMLHDETGAEVPADISEAPVDIASRYWWLDGRVYVMSYRAPIGESRRVLFLGGSHREAQAPLNIGAIPSRADLAAFRFAGPERARRVAGGDDTLERFAGGGLTAALQLLRMLEATAQPSRGWRVLDWGCGASRVLQFIKTERPDWELHGADIDTVNVRWCEENLADVARFQQLGLQPPTGYEDNSFDLIYGLSVITHLEEDTRDAWVAELSRILKPGGLCVLTYMSVLHLYQNGIAPWLLPLYSDLVKRGISDGSPDAALGADLSSYYKATYNTAQNVISSVSRDFDVVARFPRTLLFQDALVLRRRYFPYGLLGLCLWRPARLAANGGGAKHPGAFDHRNRLIDLPAHRTSRYRRLCGSAHRRGVCLGLLPIARTATIAFLPGLMLRAAIHALAGPQDRRKRLVLLCWSILLATVTGASWLLFNGVDVFRYVLLAGLISAIVLLAWRIEAGQTANLLRASLRSPALPSLIAVLEALIALTSSRNKGSAFMAPIVPAHVRPGSLPAC